MTRLDVATLSVHNGKAASGEWPPKGGPDWLTVMDPTIWAPAAFSLLR